MKKIISLVMVLAMCVCVLAACSNKNPKETEPQIVKVFELENEKITAENVSPAEGVYTMTFTNTGDKTIQNAQIVFGDGTQELMFQFEMLPAGQTITVAEEDEITVTAEELKYI